VGTSSGTGSASCACSTDWRRTICTAFRSPGAAGNDPAGLLPRAPESVLRFRAAWDWGGIDRVAFGRLVRNYGTWVEANSRPESRSAQLYSTLVLGGRPHGPIEVSGLITAETAADELSREHVTAISDGVAAPVAIESDRTSWLLHSLDPSPGLAGVDLEKAVFKLKDALLRRRFTDDQIDVAYRHLTRTDHGVGKPRWRGSGRSIETCSPGTPSTTGTTIPGCRRSRPDGIRSTSSATSCPSAPPPPLTRTHGLGPKHPWTRAASEYPYS
jgi:hypothetical protein